MDIKSLIYRFANLGTWSRGDQRALHKPLLVLYALGRWQRCEFSDIPFEADQFDLTALLKKFGPPRQSFHPEYPFWRLQNDGILTVTADFPMRLRVSNTDLPKSELLRANARGEFSDEVERTLIAHPEAIAAIATALLERYFPESLHRDIRDAVGLSLEPRSGQGEGHKVPDPARP